MQIHENYEQRGVIFLGFTVRSRDYARRFIDQSGLTWPNAYGVGALMKAAPVVYVVGADGRVAWSDDRLRMKHDTLHFRTTIEAAIERALVDPATHRGTPVGPVTSSRLTMPSHAG